MKRERGKKKAVKSEPMLKPREVSQLAADLTPDDICLACRKGLIEHTRVGSSKKFYRIPLRAAQKFVRERQPA